MKRCPIWTVDSKKLQQYLDESHTLKHVIVEKLKMNMAVPQGMHYKRLKKRIAQDHLDLTKFKENHAVYMKSRSKEHGAWAERDNNECFVENSDYARSGLKKKIIRDGILPHECSLCKTGPKWNGKELSLELDHINQINNDNRLENLRFLCPNCHSQVTNEHRKKNKKSKKELLTNLCECGTPKSKRSYRCRSCSSKYNILVLKAPDRKFNPTKEELEAALLQHQFNICAAGRHYGVSDNSIRKRCRLLGIVWK